jgi:hypothetical protein
VCRTCRYASGATIQILLFGILAIEIKRKAPTAHTVLEIVSESPVPLALSMPFHWSVQQCLSFLIHPMLFISHVVRLYLYSPCDVAWSFMP